MRIVVFGAGYVGLVTATCLAELGHDVLCVDISEEKISRLRRGEVPFYEPGLAELVRRGARSRRLDFSMVVQSAFDHAEAWFVAVGTPPRADGSADVDAVMAVGGTIAKTAKAPALVVVKSTVPVGTCDRLQSRIDEALAERQGLLEVVSNPEFLKEGAAVEDFFHPDRVVIGARGADARETLRTLYAPLQLSGERLVITDPRSSELIKYASNAMLATRISFMNEMARLCHAVKADIHAVRLGVGSDSRIGPRFLFAGPGYGGSCFPKDVSALVSIGNDHGLEMVVAAAALRANDVQHIFVLELIRGMIGSLNKRIALWGLAFKPETDDVRESPALRLAESLLVEGASVVGHDPEAMKTFEAAVGQDAVDYVDKDYDALDGADALVLLTEWRSYRAPNFVEVKRRMRGDAVIDTRNVWRSQDVTAAGLRYVGIGTR